MSGRVEIIAGPGDEGWADGRIVSLDMLHKTNMQYGVNEVLLASVLGAVVFSVLACQPLVIVGVTGPITVFN